LKVAAKPASDWYPTCAATAATVIRSSASRFFARWMRSAVRYAMAGRPTRSVKRAANAARDRPAAAARLGSVHDLARSACIASNAFATPGSASPDSHPG
jgi:hypothetical protein